MPVAGSAMLWIGQNLQNFIVARWGSGAGVDDCGQIQPRPVGVREVGGCGVAFEIHVAGVDGHHDSRVDVDAADVLSARWHVEGLHVEPVEVLPDELGVGVGQSRLQLSACSRVSAWRFGLTCGLNVESVSPGHLGSGTSAGARSRLNST